MNMNIQDFLEARGVSGVRKCASATDAIAALEALEQRNRNEMKLAAEELEAKKPAASVNTAGYYPCIAFYIESDAIEIDPMASHGYVRRGPGVYASTIARLDIPLLRAYYLEQIALLLAHYGGVAYVGLSKVKIPFQLIRHSFGLSPSDETTLAFPPLLTTSVGKFTSMRKFMSEDSLPGTFPFLLYTALQVDFLVCRMEYYTGISGRDIQAFVTLANYDMFGDAFEKLAGETSGTDGGFTSIVKPQNGSTHKKPQMPAISATRPDNSGQTLINIGVGQNALTLMECLQVFRLHAGIMNGHCAGLHNYQQVGNLLLAEAYFRRDRALDDILPLDHPITPNAEVNTALKKAYETVKQTDAEQRRRGMQTGIIGSTNRRMWECDPACVDEVINACCIGLDMETTIVAAMAWLARIPFGTILRISDMPLHRGVKLTATTHDFYATTVEEQARIVFQAMEYLREHPLDSHSRKFRRSDDPPAR